jgi:hypothetical protein
MPNYKTISKNNNVKISINELDFGKGKDNFVSDKDSIFNSSLNEYNSVIINHKFLAPKGTQNNILTIKAKKFITISKSGSIDYSGSGIPSKKINPDSKSNTISGYGGTHGGAGGSGECTIKSEKYIPNNQIDILPTFGKAGSYINNNDNTGIGGGYILLESPTITIDGSLLSDGNNGFKTGGGGGGGKIVLLANNIVINGKVSAKGGDGGTTFIQGSGGGGGGIVISSVKYTGNGKIDTSGGEGGKALDIYTGCDGQSGEDGVIASSEI